MPGRARQIERAQGDGQVVLLQWKWPRPIEVFLTKKAMDDGYYTYAAIRLMSTLSLTIVYRNKTSEM